MRWSCDNGKGGEIAVEEALGWGTTVGISIEDVVRVVVTELAEDATRLDVGENGGGELDVEVAGTNSSDEVEFRPEEADIS